MALKLRMSSSSYDKLLVILAQMAPVFLIFLNGWYESLNNWYVPLDGPGDTYSVASLEQKTRAWLALTSADKQLTYHIFVDPNCPCTKPALKKLKKAIAASENPDADVAIHDISEINPKNNSLLTAIVQEIPAVPMTIVAKGNHLIYTGPTNSGSYCTTQVDQALPILAASVAPARPVHHWVAEGCYCSHEASDQDKG